MLDTTTDTKAVRLEGAPNFRDVGGWVGHDGRRVRHGKLFRSDTLAYLRDSDFTTLEQLGIGLVCDLRSRPERSHRPTSWPASFRPTVLELDINADVRAANDTMLGILRADPSPRGATAMMMESYAIIPLALQGYMGDLFRRLADDRAPALLFHCTAGKDRTGVMAALLLLSLGVSRDDVIADYLLTRRFVDIATVEAGVADTTSHLLGGPADPDVVSAIAATREDYINRALSAIDENAGSIAGYLAAAGVDDRLLASVRDRLLHPA